MGKPNRDKTTSRHPIPVDLRSRLLKQRSNIFDVSVSALCYTPGMRGLAISLIVAAASAISVNAQRPAGSIEPPEGARAVLQAKGNGVQIYTCTDTPDGTKWTLKGPDAKLLDASGQIIGTHFAGPTWKLTDGSQVQGELLANKAAPEAGSVPWLLLRAKAGTASGRLATVAFIRRTETHGGVAPATGCQTPQDAGKTAAIPYTATYTFYAEK
jgi:hypothetical protein